MAFRDNTPEDWRTELEEGLEYRRRYGLEDRWGTFEAIYYNVHESMMNDGPNLFLSQGDTLLSTLVTPAPRIQVKPQTPEAVTKAPLVEALDNTLLEELDVVEQVETALLHAYLFGRGIVKIGYDSEYGFDPSWDIGGSLRLGLTFTQLGRKGDRLLEFNSQVNPGMPWVQAVMPHDIIVPWGTKDFSTAPWVMHRFVRHIDDLKADRKYEHTKDLQPQISAEDFFNSYRNTLKPRVQLHATQRRAEYVECFEIHDRRTGRIQTITWDHPKFLRDQPNALQINGRLPFAGIAFTPRTRAFWTTPDVNYLFHIQSEISDVAVQRTKQRRISVLKFLYDSNVISDEELAKLLSPEVGVAAKVNAGQELSKAVMKLDNAPNQALIQEEELLRANAREQMGFSRNQLGEYTSGRKTAREVGAVEQSSQLRMSRRGLQTKKLYENIIQIINGIVFTHWTTPRLVQILGESQAAEWVQINGPSLNARYSYKVDLINESEAQSAALQSLQLYSMLAQDPAVDPVELRRFLTAKFNNPAFTRIFNADVRAEMLKRALQEGNGGASANNNGGSRPPTMPQLQLQNSEESGIDASRLLA